MGKGRAPCCDKSKVKKGPWSPAEDLRLTAFIQNYGHGNWRSLPQRSGLLRCGKSCRLRWINYLRPDVKRGPLSPEEEQQIINLHSSMGNKWSKIASHLPGRTDNEIKNVWNTHLKKKMMEKDQLHSPSNSCISNAGVSSDNGEHLEMITDEIPSESDIVDLWQILDIPDDNNFTISDDSFPIPDDMNFDISDDSVPVESNTAAAQPPPPISHEQEDDEKLDLNKWLKYLENELELVGNPGVVVVDQKDTPNKMVTQDDDDDDQVNHDHQKD